MGTPANTRHYAAELLLLFHSMAVIHVVLSLLLPCHAKPDGGLLCISSEREALLSFKRGLTDPSNRLSSWAEEEDSQSHTHTDCCRWSGVVCHNSTGHVLQLRLACIPSPSPDSFFHWCDGKKVLGGKLSPSLLNLKQLMHLDLSFNDFGGVPIPTFLGSLENLRYLNLSYGGFWGTIPPQLGNLSGLQSLDLNYGNGLGSSSLEWASGLSSLQFLGLSWVNLSTAHDWLQVTSRLPSLQQLHLSYCHPPYINIPTSPPVVNISSLSVLDLSDNSLSSVPGRIFTLLALTSLSLSNNNLGAPIPAGLRNLTALTNLDFSDNQLNSSLPKWLFDLNKLEHLNLGDNSLQGRIPEGIKNMTSLTTLDLSANTGLQGGGLLLFESLASLCKLTKVVLSGIQFGGLNPFIKDAKSLSGCILRGLIELDLSGAQVSGKFSDLVDYFAQFKNLAHLVLSNNSLNGPIPESTGRLLSPLKTLDLSDNQLAGPIPASIGSLSFLERLYLSDNQLAGPIPESIGTLLSLQALRIGRNRLSGHLPESLGQLRNLQTLDTSYNPMTGDVTEIHFANLTKLTRLEALENRFILKVRPNWVPSFRLSYLVLDSWQIGPHFPQWLRSQNTLSQLQMSRAKITSTFPDWFWSSLPQFSYLNLSQNQIHGSLGESSIISQHASIIDLSSNRLSGMLPLISSDLLVLNFSNNYFSGSISPFLCHKPNQLEYLNLQSNQLWGELPDCWTNWTHLTVLRFGNNKFTGNIPSSIGFLHELQSLHFENNHLQGEIPTSLSNCKQLISMDLGGNNLIGSIPTWIGKWLPLLKILRFRSNKFDGKIPDQICALTRLQVLDLAHNNLYGSIPMCFNKFKAMTTTQKNATIPIYVPVKDLEEDALLVWKRSSSEYNKILGLMTLMDISSNNLSGEIPRDLMTLVGMRSLNLSNNFLTGKIPTTIGDMQLLDSIDLSHNELSGQIPLSMSNLTFLSYLDLSNNKLIGRIPTSTQLQSFDPSSYAGNKLCGPPITDNCDTLPKTKSEPGKEKDEVEVYMICGSMIIGFVMGFWIIWGPLLFMKSWRVAYFKSLESLFQKIHDIGSTCF